MPVIDQIDVRILINGQPLAEYQNPEAAPEAHRQRNSYVEVKTGQKFKIQVQLLPGFKLLWAQHIYFTCHVDQNKTFWYNYVAATSLKHRKGVLSQNYTSEITGRHFRNNQTGAWEKCPPTFGALGIAENDRIDEFSNITPDDVKAIGSVRLTLYRATGNKRDVPDYYHGEREHIPDELPEKMLKGLDVKNNIKFPDGERCDAPQPRTHDFVPLAGLPGESYTFNIFYRSRKCLQNLGCIPRSPSPPSDATLMLERTEDMLKLSKQRERESNLRILRLQEQLERGSSGSRNNSVQPESLNGRTLTEERSRSATVDLTGPNIKKEEPDMRMNDNPMAGGGTQRTLPAPPLFSASTSEKRAREEENDGGKAVTKRARLEAGTPMPSVAGQGAGKRKRVEEDADEDDLVELPPPPKRARVVEVVDLTDD